MPHLRNLSSNFFPYFSIVVDLLFSKQDVFISLGLFKFKMTLRRPGGRENVVGPPWLCVWRKVAVCVCQPPFFVESSQVRAAAPFGNFHLLVSGGAACPLLFSTSFTVYTFYPALQLGSIRLSLVRTWLRIPGSLEGPLPPEPEPAGPVQAT